MRSSVAGGSWRASLAGAWFVAAALGGCVASPSPVVVAPVVAAPDRVIQPETGANDAPVSPDAGVSDAPLVSDAAVVAPASSGTLGGYLQDLLGASCPAGHGVVQPDAIALSAAPITLGRLGMRRQSVGALAYVGGFHLTSPDARFGGLSGLDVLDDGNLIAVSDQGDLVWLDLADDGVTPVAARLSGMLDENGDPLRGKADGDAEGLAIIGGVALVSFERNHRFLAFDLGACGAEARGASIRRGEFGGSLPDAFSAAGLEVTANAGPEPLAVTADWYLFAGTETLKGKVGPLSARPIEAAPSFDLSIEDGAPAFVGLDLIEDGDVVRAYSLHRGFDSLSGNAIVISETVLERRLEATGLPARVLSETDERSRHRYHKISSRRLAELGAALNNVDNFEGLAVREMGDGRVRLYIISDDNFSARQRTLLMVFDLLR